MIPQKNMLSLIIVNYNDSESVINYYNSIKNYECFDHILIVDNCSTDNSYNELKNKINSKNVDIIKTDHNGGYGYGNNIGIRYVKKNYDSQYVVVSNPDVKYDEQLVNSLLSSIETKQYSILAPIMCEPSGKQCVNAAWNIPNGWTIIFMHLPFFNRFVRDEYYQYDSFSEGLMEIDCVAGSFFMVKTDDFLTVGGFDENIFLYGEEIVLGMRMKRFGFKTALIKKYFYHYHSVSISKAYRSEYKRNVMMWKSLVYILREYFGFNILQIQLVKLLAAIGRLSVMMFKKISDIRG